MSGLLNDRRVVAGLAVSAVAVFAINGRLIGAGSDDVAQDIPAYVLDAVVAPTTRAPRHNRGLGDGAPPTTRIAEFSAAAIGQRNPFSLPPELAALATETAPDVQVADTPRAGQPTLSAIVVSSHFRLAIIDDHVVTEGSAVNGSEVLRISASGVTLTDNATQATRLALKEDRP